VAPKGFWPKVKWHVRRLALEYVVGLPLWPGPARSVVLRALGVKVGRGTVIRARCVFTDPNVTFGEECWINFAVTFVALAQITLGDRVGIAHNSVIMTATHEMGPSYQRHGIGTPKPVTIGDGCWLGGCVKVLPGVTIGKGCMIAAGSVVTRDCEPDGLYGGVPAKRLKDLPID
jgi:maltose O-acetyltransferase